jgi:hypothetical protein
MWKGSIRRRACAAPGRSSRGAVNRELVESRPGE